jgi:hypothetical protein
MSNRFTITPPPILDDSQEAQNTWVHDNLLRLANNLEGNGAFGTGGGQVDSVVAGENVTVDSSDPANPIVSASCSGEGGSQNIEGGSASSIYLPSQVIDGGNA